MGTYRITRNLEASIIDYIKDELIAGAWNNISVEKTFARIYDLPVPGICVRCGTTEHEKVEIGADSTTRNPQVLIDIFGSDDGLRLDLKDFLIEVLKGGLPYYAYTIANGTVQSKVEDGRIRILEFDDVPVNFDTDREELDPHDRYRHLLTLSISLGKVEV